MAWRSSGTNNDEMVDNLKRFGVISSDVVEQGFRNVDRKFFIPKGQGAFAHKDQPLKEGNVHISAPHIYGSALEAMELVPDSSLSFLNIGSGTGYLSCIVAQIVGKRSLNFGIEIHSDVVDHSKKSIGKWRQDLEDTGRIPHIEVLHGNALNLSPNTGESAVGFDRIYIGAAVERSDLVKFTKLLRPGGVLVGPVEDELVKVVRIGPHESNTAMATDSDDFTQQVLSGVRFAPLLTLPILRTVIPSKIWTPTVHQNYPNSFRMSSKALLLCSSSTLVQPPPKQQNPVERKNLAAMLPPVLWMEVLSFTHRNWFEPPQPETLFLRKRLLEEQANAQKARQAQLDAEARCLLLERERDVFRLMARRWQTRLQGVLEQRNSSRSASQEDNDTMTVTFSGSETAAIFGLGTMLRRLHEEDDDEDEEDNGEQQNEVMMEEETEHGEEHDGDNGEMIDDSDDESVSTDMVEDEASSMMDNVEDMSTSKALVEARRQARAVSMSSDSL